MLGRDWEDAELQAALPRWRFGATRSQSGEVPLALPPHYSERQTQALLESARSAGMRVRETLSQPLAVALLGARELPEEPLGAAQEELYLVVDVGGSSSSAS